MNKKILAILSFLIVVAGMSAAAAFDVSDLSSVIFNSPADNITVSGIDFSIPEGFNEVENESLDNVPDDNPYVDYNISSKTFLNGTGEVIMVAVSSSDIAANDTFAKDASMGGNKTKINGVDGYEFNDPDFNSFTFAKDGKLVIISASDKELLNDVVIA